MKLKRLIASILSVGMLATSVVSVSASISTSLDEDNWVLIDSMPTIAAVKARAPKLAVSIDKIPNAEFSSIDTAYNKSYAKKTDATTGEYLYDMYVITYTATDFGDLAVGYDESTYDKIGVGLTAFAVYKDFGTADERSKIVASKALANDTGFADPSYGFEDETSPKHAYTAFTTATTNPYPYYGSEDAGSVNEKTEIKMTEIVVLNAGATASFKVYGETGLTYAHNTTSASETVVPTTTVTTGASYTIGTVTPAGPVVSGTTTATTAEVDNVKGKVWNEVKIENLAESDTDWVVKFTDGDESVTYDLDLAGNETQGTLSFAVILKSLTRNLANVVMEILPGTAN